MPKKRKLRTEFRKNHDTRTRSNDVTRRYAGDAESAADDATHERVSGKGDRKSVV